MSAEIVSLHPIKLMQDPDETSRLAKQSADQSIHMAVQRHKWAYGEEYTLLRLKQIVAGMEYYNATGRPTALCD